MTRRQDCVTCQGIGYVGLDREGVLLGLELPDTCPDCVVVDKPISVTCQDCYCLEELSDTRTLAVLAAEGWTLREDDADPTDPELCPRCTRGRVDFEDPREVYRAMAEWAESQSVWLT